MIGRITREEYVDPRKLAGSAWRELTATYDIGDLFIIDPTSGFCNADTCAFNTDGSAIYTDYNNSFGQGYKRI